MAKQKKCTRLECYPIVRVLPFNADNRLKVLGNQSPLEKWFFFFDKMQQLFYRLLLIKATNLMAAVVYRVL
ncbi:hypothetical protein D3C84_981780 [compost metagenome]